MDIHMPIVAQDFILDLDKHMNESEFNIYTERDLKTLEIKSTLYREEVIINIVGQAVNLYIVDIAHLIKLNFSHNVEIQSLIILAMSINIKSTNDVHYFYTSSSSVDLDLFCSHYHILELVNSFFSLKLNRSSINYVFTHPSSVCSSFTSINDSFIKHALLIHLAPKVLLFYRSGYFINIKDCTKSMILHSKLFKGKIYTTDIDKDELLEVASHVI